MGRTEFQLDLILGDGMNISIEDRCVLHRICNYAYPDYNQYVPDCILIDGEEV